MVKKPKLLSPRVPVLRNPQGSEYQPDLLVALQGGSARIAGLSEKADLRQTIRTLGRILEELKDLEWEQNRRKK